MLETTQKNLQHLCDQAVAEEFIAGVNVLVLKDTKPVLHAESGYLDEAKTRPVTQDACFRLYSMSKPITSACVMLLFQRGQIDLADPVGSYIPSFLQQMVVEGDHLVPARRPMTIRDLLSMTSGLTYGCPGTAGEYAQSVITEAQNRLHSDHPMTTIEFASRLGEGPLTFHPGSHFAYGTSADILGAIVEIVSGKSFGQFLHDEITGPLGMNDTGFYIDKSKLSRLSDTFSRDAAGHLCEEQTEHLAIHYRPTEAPAYEAGGAGLISSLPDYARFASMLLGGGSLEGTQILKPAVVRYMTGGQLLPVPQADYERDWDGLTGYSYGNLMRVMKDPGRAIMLTTPGEYGWDGWLGPYFSNHPDCGLTILIGMAKTNTGTCSLTRKIRNLILCEEALR